MAEIVAEPKKFYQKPENVLVYGVLGVLGYYALQRIDSILSLIISVLEKGIYGTFLIGVSAVIAFLLVNGDFHKLAWLGYTNLMRYLTGFVVEMDPIGAMKTAVGKLKKSLGTVKKNLGSLRGQESELVQLVAQKTKEQEDSMNLAAAAKGRLGQKGMRMEMKLMARKAGRAEESSLTYQGLLNKIRRYISLIEKIEEASNFMILDMEDTIAEESQKRRMIRTSWKAIMAAKSVLAASKERELYDMGLEANVKDFYSKLGEIQQFMEDVQHFVNTTDLQNDSIESDALAKLDAWEKRSEGLLEGGTGKTKFRVSPVGSDEASTTGEDDEHTEKRQSFADLFGNLDK